VKSPKTLTNAQVRDIVLDPRKGNLGSVGVALVNAAKR
jgi:hypothetical protein